jgi:cell division protein FtsB
MNYPKQLFWIVCGPLVLFFLIGGIAVFLPKCQQFQALQRVKDAQAEQIKALHEAIRVQESKCLQFDCDKGFVERTAREGGLVKPGETVFKFTPDVPRDIQLAPPMPASLRDTAQRR